MAAPPRPIAGEKSQLNGMLYMFTEDIPCRDTDNYMPSRVVLWNSSEDTQYRVTFTLSECNTVALDDTKNESVGVYQSLLYPGEAKGLFEGSYASYKLSMQYGTPDKAWLDKKAEAETKDVVVEIDAVKSLVQMFPAADGKYTADYIAALCEAYQVPFVDLTFPPKASPSLYRDFESSDLSASVYPWKRPHVYIKDADATPPGLWVGGGAARKIEPSDIGQGSLGNCYFLCSLSGLAERPENIERMFQLARNPDLGVYRVVMCRNGWRHCITVDDLMPTRNGAPCFARNRAEPHELWVALLEKAYAKLYGSYNAIVGGSPPHAVADCIGTPFFRLSDHPDWASSDRLQVFDYLLAADRDNAIITVSTPGSDTTDYVKGGADGEDKYKAVGLVSGHAFSVLHVKRYRDARLLCIRNPWGSDTEWNGRYCDSDPAWTPEMKAELGYSTVAGDGTFWMDWADVWKWFDSGAVNHTLHGWSCVRVAGNFEKGVSDVVMRVTVAAGSGKPVKCFVGVHQEDTRGCRPDERSGKKYVAVLTAVVKPNVDGSAHCDIVAQSDKVFMSARDVFVEATLPPCPDPSQPYYVVPLCHSEADRSFVATMWLSTHVGVTIEFVSFKAGLAKRVMHPANFVPSTCSQKVSAKVQVETPAMGGRWVAHDVHVVDWAVAPADAPSAEELRVVSRPSASKQARVRAVAAAEGRGINQMSELRIRKPAGSAAVAEPRPQAAAYVQLQAPSTPTATPAAAPAPRPQPQPQPRFQDPMAGDGGAARVPAAATVATPASTPAPAPTPPTPAAAPAPAPVLVSNRPMDIIVTVVSGSNLAARDINGKSDPYLTIAVHDANKATRGDIAPQSTAADDATLDPVWGATLTFRGVNATDLFEVSCWDKDFIGNDEFMGSCIVPVASLQLDPAGRRTMKGDFKLSGDPPQPLPFLPPLTMIPSLGEVSGTVQLVFKLA